MTRREHQRTDSCSRRQGGFTLVEVMIALLIIGMGLGILLRSAAGNLAATRRAEMFVVASELGRAMMYDLEEQLLQEGFSELDQELDGDFEDEGWENITWEAKIVKIELPNLEALGSINAADGEGDESGASSGIAGMISSFLPPGLGASAGGTQEAAQGAALIGSQFEMISNVLEESIRKVTLTMKWKSGRFEGDLVLDCYFTDPAAVTRILGPLVALAGGGGAARSPTGGGSGSGSTSTNPPTTRGGR